MPADRVVAGALAAFEKSRPWRIFDRPVFVVAGPRSGSTLLFDLLAPHPDLVSWPFEALPAYARVVPPDHPVDLGHRWPDSYATAARRRALTRELHLGGYLARRAEGGSRSRLERLALRKYRLLEKSPTSVLRMEVLAALYPNARFIVMHRDAPATIASLIEVWEDDDPLHHARITVAGRPVVWTMLQPPGWLGVADGPAASRAAFQWAAAAEGAARAVDAVDSCRVHVLRYEQLIADPESVLLTLLDFCELSHDPGVLGASVAQTPVGRTSLSAPRPDKWRHRAGEIEPLLPALAPLRRRLGYEVGTDG